MVFADAFNQFLYHGGQKIDPARLTELDTTGIVVPYGADGAGVPEQKYRDVLKLLYAMTDGKAAWTGMHPFSLKERKRTGGRPISLHHHQDSSAHIHSTAQQFGLTTGSYCLQACSVLPTVRQESEKSYLSIPAF